MNPKMRDKKTGGAVLGRFNANVDFPVPQRTRRHERVYRRFPDAVIVLPWRLQIQNLCLRKDHSGSGSLALAFENRRVPLEQGVEAGENLIGGVVLAAHGA